MSIGVYCSLGPYTSSVLVEFKHYPAGERRIERNRTLFDLRWEKLEISLKYDGDQDFIDLLLLVDAIRSNENTESATLTLRIPYFPYARQDRVTYPGEPFSLRVIANLIKGIGFSKIYVSDPHSDVLAGMFPPGVLVIKTQYDELAQTLFREDINILEKLNDLLLFIAPDAGAQKKTLNFVKQFRESVSRCDEKNIQMTTAEKVRNTATGEISGVEIHNSDLLKAAKTIIIVDDICDGGRTFIELAKKIRECEDPENRCEIHLLVTHGIFSNGMEVFADYFTTVSSAYPYKTVVF